MLKRLQVQVTSAWNKNKNKNNNSVTHVISSPTPPQVDSHCTDFTLFIWIVRCVVHQVGPGGIRGRREEMWFIVVFLPDFISSFIFHIYETGWLIFMTRHPSKWSTILPLSIPSCFQLLHPHNSRTITTLTIIILIIITTCVTVICEAGLPAGWSVWGV